MSEMSSTGNSKLILTISMMPVYAWMLIPAILNITAGTTFTAYSIIIPYALFLVSESYICVMMDYRKLGFHAPINLLSMANNPPDTGSLPKEPSTVMDTLMQIMIGIRMFSVYYFTAAVIFNTLFNTYLSIVLLDQYFIGHAIAYWFLIVILITILKFRPLFALATGRVL